MANTIIMTALFIVGNGLTIKKMVKVKSKDKMETSTIRSSLMDMSMGKSRRNKANGIM